MGHVIISSRGVRELAQDFLDISNPKAVLETTLRGFSCLTRGDCICLHYNNKRYYIDIVETRPQVCCLVVVVLLGVMHTTCLPLTAPASRSM